MKQEKVEGLLFGVAIGDALGVPVEFEPRSYRDRDPVTHYRSYGSHHQKSGTWSDDASLTFCLAENIIRGGTLHHLAGRFVNWCYNGYWAAHDKVFDVGITTARAIARMEAGVDPLECGDTAESTNGNGALMRILPVAIEMAHELDQQNRVERCRQVASLTHRHIRSTAACALLCDLAHWLINDMNREEAYEMMKKNAPMIFRQLGVSEEEARHFRRFLSEDFPELNRDQLQSSGYVIHTLEAAVWCLLNGRGFSQTVLTAVNLGDDADTTGAVAGGLAGLLYGIDDIPQDFIAQLAKSGQIGDLASRLYITVSHRNDPLAPVLLDDLLRS